MNARAWHGLCNTHVYRRLTVLVMNTLTINLARGLAALALTAWTAAGESADPTLHATDLPRGLFECSPQPQCFAAMPLTTRWIARTPTGNLFTVSCTGSDCGAWLVEKRADGVSALLELAGEYEFYNDGMRTDMAAAPARQYPNVRVREARDHAAVAVREFVFADRHYRLEQTRIVYLVDGVECGTEAQCHQAAVSAVRVGRAASALRIWSQVHGREWY